jgi:hypothetical protein
MYKEKPATRTRSRLDNSQERKRQVIEERYSSVRTGRGNIALGKATHRRKRTVLLPLLGHQLGILVNRAASSGPRAAGRDGCGR